MKGMNSKMNEMDNQQLTLVELGWLAGIIDGEGYIGVLKQHDKKCQRIDNTVTVQLHISNCDEAIVLKARDIMRKMGLNPYVRFYKTKKRRSRDHYRLQVKHMAKMVKLLDPLIPYLTGNTKRRAEIVLEFCRLRREQKPEQLPKVKNGGRLNSGTHKPLTRRMLDLIIECGKLSARGSSETTRMALHLKSRTPLKKIDLQRNSLVGVKI